MITTVIGSYPKPSYLQIPDWFSSNSQINLTHLTTNIMLKEKQEKREPLILKAIHEVIKEQTDIGINIITDGEIRRENYIYSFCRSLNGIDFENLTENIMRNGAYKINCPTVVSKLSYKPDLYQSDEWLISNKIAEKHGKILKYTLPGPMTICDSISDIYYNNDKQLCKDLAKLIRREIVPLYSWDTFHSFAYRQYDMEISMLVNSVNDMKKSNLNELQTNISEPTRRMSHSIEKKMFRKFNNIIKDVDSYRMKIEKLYL